MNDLTLRPMCGAYQNSLPPNIGEYYTVSQVKRGRYLFRISPVAEVVRNNLSEGETTKGLSDTYKSPSTYHDLCMDPRNVSAHYGPIGSGNMDAYHNSGHGKTKCTLTTMCRALNEPRQGGSFIKHSALFR